MDIQIGKVTHYFDKIGVAIVEVKNQPLKVGDHVRFSGHDSEFSQEVTSMQVEHDKISEIAPGETAGIKVDKPVKAGDVVYLATQ